MVMKGSYPAAYRREGMDVVFKALADPSRRELLDRLNARNGQSLNELGDGLGMARQSVSKHLAVLEAANLVTAVRRGRERLHYLNTAPIADIADRWIDRYHRRHADALADLKHALEDPIMTAEFVYSTYIKTTPEQLWAALTEPAFTLRYWGVALHSDWQVGSPVRWQTGPDGEAKDLDQVVLEATPFRRLAYTWHNYQPEHAELFGWSEERFAQLTTERRAKVTFAIEPAGAAVKLTVTHDGFEAGSEMLEACSGRKPQAGGWPQLIANLKTLLETGTPLDDRSVVAAQPSAR
jgi:DNA-binding transcriptional ArsR family regulator/uncharacterized protein YndB with AHSA1/START domain